MMKSFSGECPCPPLPAGTELSVASSRTNDNCKGVPSFKSLSELQALPPWTFTSEPLKDFALFLSLLKANKKAEAAAKTKTIFFINKFLLV
jgi:hypothetical protein